MNNAPSVATIDLGAYAHNLGVVRGLIPEGCRILAVVKANGYGHGAVAIAQRAVKEGVAMLGVATVGEAIELRRAGIGASILVMAPCPPEDIPAAIENDLRLTVSDVAGAERIGKLAQKANKVAPVHCKIDSGMGRIGFDISKAAEELLFLTRISYIDIEGIATHFPIAELTRDPFTSNQIRAFRQLARELGAKGIPYEILHAANSAGILYHPQSSFDMVRAGLMTYGVWPGEQTPNASLRPVLSWRSKVALVRELPAGASIGYGRTYTTTRPTKIAVLIAGYADGYRYGLGNKADVLIRGRRCPLRGVVTMDQLAADVTDVPGIVVGDAVTLIGADGDQRITAEELAQRSGTIAWDILTAIGPRAGRAYIE